MGFNAYRCERCGKYYVNHIVKFDTADTPKENFAMRFIEGLCDRDEIELCETCIKDFGKWFDIESK